MIEKELELDKTNFVVNGYEVDEEQYPQQPDKNTSLIYKAKIKADEVMTVDLSEEDIHDENVVSLGDENATLDYDAQESNDNDGEKELYKRNGLKFA